MTLNGATDGDGFAERVKVSDISPEAFDAPRDTGGAGPDVHRRRRRRRPPGRHQRHLLALALRRIARRRRPDRPAERPAVHHHRRDAGRLRLPRTRHGGLAGARSAAARGGRSRRPLPVHGGATGRGCRASARPATTWHASPASCGRHSRPTTPPATGRLGVESLRARQFGHLQLPLAVLLAAAGSVLLIACVNVAIMALLRAVARRRELSIRLAVGAGRGAIARQLLVEAAVVATLGAVAGTAVARVRHRRARRLRAGQRPAPRRRRARSAGRAVHRRRCS